MQPSLVGSVLFLTFAPALLAQEPMRARTFAEANTLAKAPRWLSLRWAEFDTRNAPPALADSLRAAEAEPDSTGYWLLQFAGPIREETKAATAACGLEVLDYVPNYAFIVRGTSRQLARARQLPEAAWSGEFHPAYRIDPDLLGLAPEAPRRFVVVAFAGVGSATLTAQIAASKAQIVTTDSTALARWQATVVGTPAQMLELARGKDVQWIQEEPVGAPRNNTMTWTVQTGILNDTKIWNQGLHGENQVIGHMDGSILTTSCYFQDTVNPIGPNHRKILYHSGAGTDAHGTHTAGTAAGDSFPINGLTTNRGLAYAAKIAHSTSYPTTTFGTVAGVHGTYGARVHTNSWGNDTNSTYDAFCAAVDAFAWTNEDHLVCFAITNQNRMVTHPDVAKNLLAVGSSGNGTSANTTCFSGGFGPTLDGRRKPEVYTPGCAVVSAGTAACSTASMTGSSMACPSTTAAAALVRQYFMDGYYPSGTKTPTDAFVPTGALLKAMLINSANDMTGIAGYPSAKEGWGKLTLDQGLPFPGDSERLFAVDVRMKDGLQTGKTYTYKLPVISSSVPLRVTLAYHDAPGLANATNPVVNDVDLVVIAPDTTSYLGNVIDTNTGWSQPSGATDAKNNVERVLIAAPALGIWTIKVTATNVPQGPQGFALCATGSVVASTTFAANIVYGAGKAGTNGVPAIGATSTPRVGNANYAVTLGSALANANLGWFFGATPATIAFDGGTLLVNPLGALGLVASATGSASLTIPVPDDYSLVNASLYSQYWVVGDPGASGAGFACSAGLQTRIGN